MLRVSKFGLSFIPIGCGPSMTADTAMIALLRGSMAGGMVGLVMPRGVMRHLRNGVHLAVSASAMTAVMAPAMAAAFTFTFTCTAFVLIVPPVAS